MVIGGGNSAIDAARTAVRLGAESVTVVYRRSREVMPAYKEEIEEAIHEGVKLRLLTAPVDVVVESGRVAGIRCRPMRLGQFDGSGRRRPEEGGELFTIPADEILVAIGQSLASSGFCDEVGIETHRNGFLIVDPVSGQTSQKWIFAGGDAVSGPSSVVEAVAAGERAAVGIDKYLTGSEHAFCASDKGGGYPLRPGPGSRRHSSRASPADSGGAALQQLRRSGTALARGGCPSAGPALPPLRLRPTPERARGGQVDPAVPGQLR